MSVEREASLWRTLMNAKSKTRSLRERVLAGTALVALLSNNCVTMAQSSPGENAASQAATATPIKHVIVLIGENRTFDHLFATYAPRGKEFVSNLLSKGIV